MKATSALASPTKTDPRAFIPGVASPSELDDELVRELARGIATGLNLYAELGFESFNMALYGRTA